MSAVAPAISAPPAWESPLLLPGVFSPDDTTQYGVALSYLMYDYATGHWGVVAGEDHWLLSGYLWGVDPGLTEPEMRRYLWENFIGAPVGSDVLPDDPAIYGVFAGVHIDELIYRDAPVTPGVVANIPNSTMWEWSMPEDRIEYQNQPVVVGLRGVMDAIASQIRLYLDQNLDGVQVEPRLIFNPTPPCVDVYPADPFLDATSFGTPNPREAVFVVRARVTTADNDGGQDLLLDLLDPSGALSMLNILSADSTFGGAVDDSGVPDPPSGYVVYETTGGGGALLGCEWRLRVIL